MSFMDRVDQFMREKAKKDKQRKLNRARGYKEEKTVRGLLDKYFGGRTVDGRGT